MANEETPKNLEIIEFKKPTLVGRVGKLPKKIDTSSSDSQRASILDGKGYSSEESASGKKKDVTTSNVKAINIPFPYKEPKWSGLCPDGSGYALEILKSGMILERIELTNQAYYVFGRLANCDIVMSHPTASRHHAILQYKAFAGEGEPPAGWYLYDLSSTHGTFHNGTRLKQEHYSRVRVGHQIKFGTSSRTYILMGPDYDCEGESDLTVTEIKQKAKELKMEREKMIQEAIKQREIEKLQEEKKREEQGIDWGMGEDAEEEPDLADNPFAVAANEELYLADPKKTLRGYFEREGHELEYRCEERGVGQFLCRVELPIDDSRGRPLVAEALHRGKKKEAVVACALEACRLLDRAGLLRQATHESRRRKQRDYSAEDYYSSDEDTFLDRTGAVERRRRRRMREHGALPPRDAQPRTHDDLLKEISELESKIAAEERVLARLRESGRPAAGGGGDGDGGDALDEYMSSLGRQGQTMAQKAEISNTKLTIQKLRSELSQTQRLAELARPASAPPLVRKDDRRLGKFNNSVVYGKRIKLKDDIDKKLKPKKEVKTEETEFVEEMDSDDEESKTEDNGKHNECSTAKAATKTAPVHIENNKTIDDSNDETQTTDNKNDEKYLLQKSDREINEAKNEADKALDREQKSDKTQDREEVTAVKRVFGPMRPPENYVIPENYFDQETDRDLPEIEENDTM